MDQRQYQQIVDAYRETGSVDRTAALCDTYPIKVRKVLITEGLWHSKKSDAVKALRERGYSVPEIAERLGMDEKNVQFYLPYANRGETEEGSGSRERVRDFRERGRKAEEGSLFRTDGERNGKMVKKETDVVRERISGAAAKSSSGQNDRRELMFREQKGSVKEMNGQRKKTDQTLEPKGWEGYLLRFELVRKAYELGLDYEDLFADVPDAESLKALMKAQNGIYRDVIVPGWMNLHQLHYVIQEAFGFNNSHLHHFELPGELFTALTGGTAGGWAELCGALWHAPVAEDFSDLYWDDDYKQGKSAKVWVRSKYTGERMDYAVGETYPDSLRLLMKDMEFIRRKLKLDGDGRKPEELSLEEYSREQEGEINRVLERLKVRDVLEVSPCIESGLAAWRKALLERMSVSKAYLEALRGTRSFRSLEEAMRRLRELREERSNLDQAIWLHREELRRELGGNPEAHLEELNRSIHDMERKIGDAMHVFDPEVTPVADTLYYHYDYGDDWLIRVTCREIWRTYDRVWPEERERTGEKEPVMVKLGMRDPGREKRLEDCGWGKDYAAEPVYRDTKGAVAAGDFFCSILKRAEREEKPVCVVARGVPPVEDVGGPHGLMDFIRGIHGADAEEAASLRTWARDQGWKGTVPAPERLL